MTYGKKTIVWFYKIICWVIISKFIFEYISILILNAEFLTYYQIKMNVFWKISHVYSKNILRALPYHNSRNAFKEMLKAPISNLSVTLTAWGENIILFASSATKIEPHGFSQQVRHFQGTKTSFHGF